LIVLVIDPAGFWQAGKDMSPAATFGISDRFPRPAYLWQAFARAAARMVPSSTNPGTSFHIEEHDR
jgi:hypothetical protein